MTPSNPPGSRCVRVPDLRKLDICFLAGTLGRGGSEQQLFYILRALRRHGARLRVVSLDRAGIWDAQIQDLGIPLIRIKRRRPRIARIASIVAQLRPEPPQILQSHHLFANLYAVAAARLLRCRDIGALRGDVTPSVAKLGPLAGPISLRLPGLLAVNSLNAMEAAAARGVPRPRMFYLPNVVGTDDFVPAAEGLGQPLRLLWVGRMVPEKRVDRFLSILARLRSIRSEPVQGVVVGAAVDPNFEQAIAAQVKTLGLHSNDVAFRGELSTTALQAEYRAAAILVVTSDREGTPNVVLEAMASGLPVVSTPCGDVPRIVQNGVEGYVHETEAEDRMVKSLQTLLNDASLRQKMGQNARERATQQYSLERLPYYLGQLYNTALGGGNSGAKAQISR